jgi:hypothetical protein
MTSLWINCTEVERFERVYLQLKYFAEDAWESGFQTQLSEFVDIGSDDRHYYARHWAIVSGSIHQVAAAFRARGDARLALLRQLGEDYAATGNGYEPPTPVVRTVARLTDQCKRAREAIARERCRTHAARALQRARM